jgi:hypothetical protein
MRINSKDSLAATRAYHTVEACARPWRTDWWGTATEAVIRIVIWLTLQTPRRRGVITTKKRRKTIRNYV